MADEEHVLLLCIHHIVSDGWSTAACCLRELGALYAAFARGEGDPLPPLPVQYADYAVWQREQLQGEALDRQIGYWKERLAGAPALLELPTDRPRPPVQSHRGAREMFDLPLRAARPSPGAGPERGRHAVHGDAGRLPAAAVEVQRERGRRRRQPDRRADAEARWRS